MKLVPPSPSVLFPLILESSRKDQHSILHVKHLLVKAIFHQELVVGAALDDSTTIEYQDLIHPLHRDQAVGHHQRGSPLHQRIEGIQHRLLCQGIKVGGCLVQDEQGGV